MNIDKVYMKGIDSSIRMIREIVFIEEQGFINEFDEIDSEAIHVLVYADGEPAATGRLFQSEDEQDFYIIGRVAVLSNYRKSGLGSKVMDFLEDKAREIGATGIKLSAQCQAKGFYKKRGYEERGEVYQDEGCPHILMIKYL